MYTNEFVMQKLILHLDADAFFASVEQGFNPHLQGKPVIVGGLAHQRGCVHTASYEARRLGIHTGTSLRQAKEICPKAIFLQGDYRRYRAAALGIEKILRSHTPDVEIASLDDAYIDLTGVMRRYSYACDFAEKIQKEIRQQINIGVSIGIGSSKLIARIASGLHKPEGITAVPAGYERQFLSILPVRVLRGIGMKTETVFHELGITTVGELTLLPKTTVLQLLGAAVGAKIWQYAHGVDNRPLQVQQTPKQISRETSFEEDSDDDKLIEGALRYLTERIAAKLRQHDLTARKVHIKIRYADGRSQKRPVTLSRRTGDGELLGACVQKIYNSFPKRRVRVKLVGVTVFDIADSDEQWTLFDMNDRSDRLNNGIDRVRERFGFTSLQVGSTLVLQDYYRMESHGYILHTPALSQ
ncbi:DNA polymerase IV [candidate division KSB1 bacterium]